ncbi:MAG: flavin reductase family protein [Treponema sp.]|jgi:flavin reductase (DIM6/NTAB) family NADH-FMN oxidoreductase RutF|nr:flavin reductase family protein [Treponema sp.]
MKQKDVAAADEGWKALSIRDFSGSPSSRIGESWMLITAGSVTQDKANWNTMTAAWGGLGVLWGRDAAFIFIRPSRHTFAFANENSLFTLSFFDRKYREALNICGSESGRDIDKAGKAGLSPVVFDGSLAGGKAAGAIGFKEASDIIVCRKLYTHDFDPACFLDPVSIEKNYNGKDYHRMYIGEILTLLSKC